MKCCGSGCVYWARVDDMLRRQCPACFALNHDPSDQRTPVLPPSVLTPAPKWSTRVPRLPDVWVDTDVTETGHKFQQFIARTHGRSDRDRPWTKVRKLRMHTLRTQPDDGACWAS